MRRTRIRRPDAPARLALLAIFVTLQGCAAGASSSARINGVISLTYNGLDVVVEGPSDPKSERFMLVRGVESSTAILRPGESFTISDGVRTADEYEVLSATAERVTFRRITTTDERDEADAQGAGAFGSVLRRGAPVARTGVRRETSVLTIDYYDDTLRGRQIPASEPTPDRDSVRDLSPP